MKKSTCLQLFFIIFLFSQVARAQSGARQADQFQRQIEEIMRAREEMFRMLMDDKSFDDFDKRFEQIMKNFHQQGDFDLQQFDDPIVGEYDWIKTDTHKILKLKVKQVKDRPLDIKIENGVIRLKGDVETVEGKGPNAIRRKVSFQRAFSLPEDVDQTSPEFENQDGSMLIKFKLKRPSAKGKAKNGPATSEPDRIPVGPDDAVPTI